MAAVVDDGEVGLALKGRIANLAHNWDQSRQYHASLSQRVEGFAEAWGDGSSTRSSTAASADGKIHHPDWTADEVRSVERILELPYPQQSLTLFQYRPAWEEQLALLVLGKKFVVVNCPFAVWEATGPLPCLRDLHAGNDESKDGDDGAADTGRPPVLVGSHQRLDSPSSGSQQGNSILDYLRDAHISPVDTNGNNDDIRGWDRDFLDSMQKSQAQLFVELVRGTIDPCLAVLGLDWIAYDQVYRQMAIRASCGDQVEPPRWSRWQGWWQVWSERVQIKRQLSHSQRRMSIQEALDKAREALQLCEQHLATLHLDGKNFFMGTKEPVLVDIVLWSCLARSLSNLHMVTVLAEFPALCRYAQHLWDKYFDLKSSAEAWRVWNAEENCRNPFGQLPMMNYPSASKSPRDFTNAIDLMKQLSLQRHDLHEQLLLARQRGIKDPGSLRAKAFQTFHRWRFGDSYRPQTMTSSSPATSPQSPSASQERQDEKALREYQKHDQWWIATVLVASVSSALLFGFAG